MKEIMVSIICITYNHAEFIRDAIEGFLDQKTDFNYEIIIHDDCSTDGTTEIVKEYADKYPSVIRAILEEDNCYSRGIKITERLHLLAEGKYIAICEGDDYWCDCHKLQKQIDYMENHPECSLTMHNGYLLEYVTGIKKPINPYGDTGILSASEVIKERETLPPTASMIYRRHDIVEIPDFFGNAPVGDRPRRMYLVLRGYAYYFSDIMCVYRYGTPGSFGKRAKNNNEYSKKILDKMLAFYDQYNEYTNGEYKNEIDYVKSKEWFHYYRRIGECRNSYKTLYFKSQFNFAKKMKYRIYDILPNKIKMYAKRVEKFGRCF